MQWPTLKLTMVSAIFLLAAGCATAPDARYVYQDGEFGVIGIPQNSPYGRKSYLKQAEEMMTRHFPDGYEIVRAEEVVEGQRMLDTETRKGVETEPTVSALNQVIKLGKLARSMSLQQKDTVPILESRIIYKRKMPNGPVGANGFASVASLTPPFYLDPNEVTRCQTHKLIAAAGTGTGDVPKALATTLTDTKADGKGNDSTVKKIAHEDAK